MVSSTKNSNEEFRRHAPAPLSPRPLNLPTPREATLANGLQVVVVEDHRLPLVSLRLGFHEGSVNDPSGRPGLTAFMTGLLTEGTKTRKSRQIADESAMIGATISAGANSDYLTVAASALSEYTSNIFELLADVTLNPSFPEEELALAKENTKQALIQQRAQPSFLASEQTARVLFGEHPYSVVSPTPESIDATSREELLQFHLRSFLPNRAVLIAVGDVEFEQVRSEAEKLFGNWQAGESIGSSFPDPPVATERHAYVVDRPGSEQSNIVIANHAIKRTDPDFFPMLLLHTVLGANASSRLFMNLREEKGYTYGAYSSLDARTYGGTFRATSEVRTSVTGPALDEFFYELERIRNEDVTDKELADAKAYLTGVFPIRLETQEGLTDQLVQMKMLGLPNDYLHTYRQNVDAVSIADIRRVANKHITPAAAAIVIVGDSSKIAEEVSRFAENVEVFDSSGRRKSDKSADSDSGSGANLTGSWSLQLQLPTGQTVPATLRVEHGENGLTGAVQSQFGDADLSNIVVDGQNLQAAVSLAIMGRKMDGDVGFFVEGDHVKGSINVPGLPQIHFEGSRGE
jgi:zinc protease